MSRCLTVYFTRAYNNYDSCIIADPAVGDDEPTVEASEQYERQDEAEEIIGNVEINELIQRVVAKLRSYQQHIVCTYRVVQKQRSRRCKFLLQPV